MSFLRSVGRSLRLVAVLCLLALMVSSPASQGMPSSTPTPSKPQGSPQSAPVATPPSQPFAQAPAQPPAPQLPPGTVVLTVGAKKITAADFERIMGTFPPQQRASFGGPAKRRFAEQYASMIALVDEARRRKLDADPLVKEKVAMAVEQALAQAMYQALSEGVAVSESDVKAYYDSHLSSYEEIKASQVLVRVKGASTPAGQEKKELTEEEAKAKAEEIYARVTAPGADFAAIAKADSDDPRSAANGGDLGWIGRNKMVPAFDSAAFNMKPGEISKPVRSPFGYHVIRVEERRTKPVGDVKDSIASVLKPEKMTQAMEEVKKAAGIVINDAYFPAAPPRPPMPPPSSLSSPSSPSSPSMMPSTPPGGPVVRPAAPGAAPTTTAPKTDKDKK